MNKVAWSRVLLWVAVALLPGAMLLLPLALLILGRKRTSARAGATGIPAVPAQAELVELPPASSQRVQLASV